MKIAETKTERQFEERVKLLLRALAKQTIYFQQTAKFPPGASEEATHHLPRRIASMHFSSARVKFLWPIFAHQRSR